MPDLRNGPGPGERGQPEAIAAGRTRAPLHMPHARAFRCPVRHAWKVPQVRNDSDTGDSDPAPSKNKSASPDPVAKQVDKDSDAKQNKGNEQESSDDEPPSTTVFHPVEAVTVKKQMRSSAPIAVDPNSGRTEKGSAKKTGSKQDKQRANISSSSDESKSSKPVKSKAATKSDSTSDDHKPRAKTKKTATKGKTSGKETPEKDKKGEKAKAKPKSDTSSDSEPPPITEDTVSKNPEPRQVAPELKSKKPVITRNQSSSSEAEKS